MDRRDEVDMELITALNTAVLTISGFATYVPNSLHTIFMASKIGTPEFMKALSLLSVGICKAIIDELHAAIGTDEDRKVRDITDGLQNLDITSRRVRSQSMWKKSHETLNKLNAIGIMIHARASNVDSPEMRDLRSALRQIKMEFFKIPF